jgi:hypothetical protein
LESDVHQLQKFLTMSKRLKKVRSNVESDGISLIISGNLHEVPTPLESIDFDEDSDLIDFECSEVSDDTKVLVDDVQCTLEDYQKANRRCDEVYGVNLLEIFTKLLISEDLDVKDFVVQSLAYKVQSLTRGPSGVR